MCGLDLRNRDKLHAGMPEMLWLRRLISTVPLDPNGMRSPGPILLLPPESDGNRLYSLSKRYYVNPACCSNALWHRSGDIYEERR